MSFALLKPIDLVIPLRAAASNEAEGLDVIMHGEEAYLHDGIAQALPAGRLEPQTAAVQRPVEA
jgi:hypothetical protein